jgi:integrase
MNELRVHEKAKRPQICEPDKDSEPTGRTVADACAKFLADARARGLREPTTYKYELLLRRLLAFTAERDVLIVPLITLELLREFRAKWPHRNTAGRKRLEELRAFFRFCYDAQWIDTNPAKNLHATITAEPPREPFTDEEVEKIRVACTRYPNGRGRTHRKVSQRLTALVELMLHTGLRIGDAVTLRRDRIMGGMLRLRTEKTNVPVDIPLPPQLLTQLECVEGTSSEYFFWTGNSKRKSVVGDWQRALKTMFKLAGIPEGHAHRFRHTFVKWMLMDGKPPDRIAVLTGHRGPAILIKHYSSWSKERQRQAEVDVRRVWAEKYRPNSPDKTLKRPESAIQTLYSDSSKWLN